MQLLNSKKEPLILSEFVTYFVVMCDYLNISFLIFNVYL